MIYLTMNFNASVVYSNYLYLKIPAMLFLLVIFILWELKQFNPFVNIRILSVNLFLNTTFLRQIGITFILYMILYGLPQWMEQTKGIKPSHVGLLMLPLPVMATAMSLLFSKTREYILLLTLGILGVISASIVVFFFSKESSIYLVMFMLPLYLMKKNRSMQIKL